MHNFVGIWTDYCWKYTTILNRIVRTKDTVPGEKIRFLATKTSVNVFSFVKKKQNKTKNKKTKQNKNKKQKQKQNKTTTTSIHLWHVYQLVSEI